jgi:hypothetical protein
LAELDARLRRIEASTSTHAAHQPQARLALTLISRLRTDIRRQIALADTLNKEKVVAFERQIDEIRDAASLANYERSSPLFGLFESLFTDRIGLLNLTAGLKIGLNQLGPDEVLELVPGQKTAAFQFEFRDDSLVTVDQLPRTTARETAIADSALEAAIEHASEVSVDLDRSNCSPRLKEAFARLRQTLETHKNIVQVGQCAHVCNRLIQSEMDEISDTQFALLTGHVEMVYSALAQFEDWRIFSDNAAMVQIDQVSVVKLTEGARETIRLLQENENVDRTVTDALKITTGWVEDSGTVEKRDVLSLARTLENIWSVVSKILLAIGKETASEAKKAIARSIVVFALLNGTAIFVPALEVIPGAGWVRTVYSYLTAGKGVGTPPAP